MLERCAGDGEGALRSGANRGSLAVEPEPVLVEGGADHDAGHGAKVILVQGDGHCEQTVGRSSGTWGVAAGRLVEAWGAGCRC